MINRRMLGVVGLGLSAVAAVPAVGRAHYTGQVPPSIMAADPVAPALVVPPGTGVASHKRRASAKHAAAQASTTTHVAHKKHHKRKHKAKVKKSV